MKLEQKGITCCFTGYRPAKLPWGFDESDARCLALEQRLYDVAEAVYVSGIRNYVCGMARGCDMLFARAVLRLRETCKDVRLIAAVPFPGQADRWPEADRRRYEQILSQCAEVSVVSPEYSAGCMRRRNEYMVDASSLLIAVYDGKQGGTMMTVNYARKNMLELIVLAP